MGVVLGVGTVSLVAAVGLGGVDAPCAQPDVFADAVAVAEGNVRVMEVPAGATPGPDSTWTMVDSGAIRLHFRVSSPLLIPPPSERES